MTAMNQYQEIAAVLTCFALACTVLTLLIISKMKWNGFILILTSLSISQFIFDFSFLFFYFHDFSWYYSIFLYVYIFGELTVALWTNLISVLTFRIVYNLKTVNIYQEYPYYLFIDLCVPLILVFYSAAEHQLNIDILNDAFRVFYWFRLMSVFFNIIFYLITHYFVQLLKKQVSVGKLSAVQAQAITVMVGRMKYYSVVQVVIILPGCVHAWNKWTLADPATNYIYFSTAPLCGIAYFLVFLNMQPTAMKVFTKYLLKYLPFMAYFIKNKTENVDEVLEANNNNNNNNNNNTNTARESEMVPVKDTNFHVMSDEDLALTIDRSGKGNNGNNNQGLELKQTINTSKTRQGEDRDSFDSFDSDEDAVVGNPSELSLGTTSSVLHETQVMV